jgi:hypothetical protein
MRPAGRMAGCLMALARSCGGCLSGVAAAFPGVSDAFSRLGDRYETEGTEGLMKIGPCEAPKLGLVK